MQLSQSGQRMDNLSAKGENVELPFWNLDTWS